MAVKFLLRLLFLVLDLLVERYLPCWAFSMSNRTPWYTEYTQGETRGESVALEWTLSKPDGLFDECSSHLNLTLVLQSGKFSGSSPAVPSQPQGLSYAEDAAEHENMKAVLKTSSPALEDATPVLGVRTRSRASRGNFCWWCGGWYSQVDHPRKFLFIAMCGLLCPESVCEEPLRHSGKLLRRGTAVLGLFTYIYYYYLRVCVCAERVYYCMHVVFREQVCFLFPPFCGF